MKTILIIIICLSFSARAIAGVLEKDDNGNPIQGAAPNGYMAGKLTAASITMNFTGFTWWSIYPTTACKYRIMPTSAKGIYPQFTLPVNTHFERYVNQKTPFVNFSGCTNGELSGQ